MNNIQKETKLIKRYSESLKHKIVEEVEGGVLTVRQAMDMYDIRHRRTVTGWIRQYGKEVRPTKIVRGMMKSEQERIKELERALVDSQLKNMVHEEMLKLYAKEVPDLKKRLNTKQLKKFEAAEKKRSEYLLKESAR